MMTQKDMILDMLEKGTTVSKLTTLPLGIGNLAEVVRMLRRAGHEIATVSRQDVTGRKFTCYELMDDAA